jgi:hypothetical protein
MTLPAGSHTVTFRFEPESYKTGNRVSLAGSVLLLAFLLLAALPFFKRNSASTAGSSTAENRKK